MARPTAGLLQDLRRLIAETRQDVAREVNSALALLYWRTGRRIREDILDEKRAQYGEQIVATLSQQLSAEFGPGWSRYNLARMIRFAEELEGTLPIFRLPGIRQPAAISLSLEG